MLTPPKGSLKSKEPSGKCSDPVFQCSLVPTAALVQGENKIPCRQFVGEKAPQRAQKRLAAKAFAGGA